MSKDTKNTENVTASPVTTPGEYVTRAEAMKMFPVRITRNVMRGIVASGALIPIRVSRLSVFFRRAEVEAFIAAKFEGAPIATQSKGGPRGSYGKKL